MSIAGSAALGTRMPPSTMGPAVMIGSVAAVVVEIVVGLKRTRSMIPIVVIGLAVVASVATTLVGARSSVVVVVVVLVAIILWRHRIGVVLRWVVVHVVVKRLIRNKIRRMWRGFCGLPG